MMYAVCCMLYAVQVQGPFYAPAKTATDFSTHATVLVASGIGITPFFSVIATKVADEQSFEGDRDLYQALFQEDLRSRGGSINASLALKNLSTAAKGVGGEDVQVRLLGLWTMLASTQCSVSLCLCVSVSYFDTGARVLWYVVCCMWYVVCCIYRCFVWCG
jgi:hypothetical protein